MLMSTRAEVRKGFSCFLWENFSSELTLQSDVNWGPKGQNEELILPISMKCFVSIISVLKNYADKSLQKTVNMSF